MNWGKYTRANYRRAGTRLREMFANHETVPPEFSRPEVLKVLQAYYDTVS